MISNELYDGQGLGNQLWNYALTRIIADKNHCDFSIIGKENFKGREFMNINFGSNTPESNFYYKEKTEYLVGTDIDISRTDSELLNIKPFTKFDGNCQSAKYLEGYKEKLREWIEIKNEYINPTPEKNTCVIHFRAGDFKKIKDVFLPQKYYLNAINHVRTLNKDVKFYCVTDEKEIAERILPNIEIIGSALLDKEDSTKATHHKGGPLGIDFTILLQADYLIIPNSSFSWWAAYLNKNKKAVIAPKYWARHNISDGYWSTSDIITDDFTYIDKKGSVFSTNDCWIEKEQYEKEHPEMFSSKPELRPPFFKKITRFLKNTFLEDTTKYIRIKDIPQKKYDAFIFFNELELLEIRLSILDESVDYFVLVEATQTFTGKQKPLYYLENKERFAKWNNKIIHFVVDEIPSTPEEIQDRLKKDISQTEKDILEYTQTTDNIPQDAPQWMREFYQKECIKKALEGLPDEAICFVSDIDEIWNPDSIINYDKDKVFKVQQKVYVYYLNNRSSEKWAGTFLTSYGNIKNSSINHLDTPSKTRYTYIKNGGWHFTNMGGADRIREKLESYGHQEFNNDKIKLELEKKMESNKDFIGRRFKFWIDETNLPEYIINNRSKYKNLFK